MKPLASQKHCAAQLDQGQQRHHCSLPLEHSTDLFHLDRTTGQFWTRAYQPRDS